MKNFRTFLPLAIVFLLIGSLHAQVSPVSPFDENDETSTPKFERKSYNEIYFQVGGRGYSMGLSHLKELGPRTTVLIGGSYSNFRMPVSNSESRYFQTSLYNLRSEIRYYLIPRENKVSAFAYAAVNNSFIQLPGKPVYNLGLEFGGEVRYRIAENAFFSVRTSFHRQNANPYYNQQGPWFNNVQ